MSKKEEDDLAGFRDFLDGGATRRPKAASGPAKNHGFELLSFLEVESARLDKHLDLLSEKSAVIKNCDSYERLNKEINREISLKNARLVSALFKAHSPMMKSLDELFKSFLNT